MDQFSVENYQREQSEQITRAISRQSNLQAQKIIEHQTDDWNTAHKHLVDILRLIDTDFDESCQKTNNPLDDFSDGDLSYIIQIRLKKLLTRSTPAQPQESIAEVRRELLNAQKLINELEKKIEAEEQRNRDLLAKVTGLEDHLQAISQVQPNERKITTADTCVGMNELVFPDWVHTWKKSQLFEKTSAAILVIGRTGKSLRPGIIKDMAETLSLAVTNKGLNDAITYLLSQENGIPVLAQEIIIEDIKGSSSGGNLPMILKLSASGEIAYQVLTGLQPIENEYELLLKHHASPMHTLLNIQAIEILSEEGYLVLGRAEAIHLSDGETYIPDLAVKELSSGTIHFIEVECDVNKDFGERKRKWMKAYEASGGDLYIFCDNLTCQRSIQAEINMVFAGLQYSSHLTNYYGLHQGKRSGKDHSMWLSQKVCHKE